MLEIDNHNKENTFVTTSAVSSCVQLLKANDVLVLTGRAGSGKSRNSLEILRQYKVLGYDVIKLSDLKDFEDSFKGDVETIILCEDIFGRTNNVFTQNSDVEILDRVHAGVNLGKTKVIFTIRDIVKRSCKWVFSSYRLFYKSVEVDLSSKELELKLEEKKSLFVRYCNVNNFEIVGLNEQENFKDEVILDNKVIVKLNLITLNQIIQTDPILGFPQTCCLFTGNRKFTRLGEAFFKHPSSCLTEEIENLRKSGKDKFSDKIKYSLLVYVLLNGDFLNKNQINSNQMGEIMVSCYHNEDNTISEHYLSDAIDEMIGQYLIKEYDTDSYQFQHQTVLESVLISYSRINPELIWSKLAFNFIREMVRLVGFKEKEGEIVMKIPTMYYPKLCERILEILESEYCLRSQNLIQLLCDSEIVRQNDKTFVKSLIEVAHRVLPLKDTTTIIALPDDHESVHFYLPAALLEHVISQKHLFASLVQLLEHTRYIIQQESKIDIVQSCKASVLSAFLSSVIQDHTDEIVTLILNIINDFKLTDDNDSYFTKVILLTPPRNEKMMMLLLRIIDPKYVDLQQIFLEICLRNWTNILPLLKKDMRTSGIDLTGAIGDLCRSGRYEVVKWLLHIIELSNKLINTNINANNKEIFQWFCDNVDKGKFNIRTALREICETGNIEIVQWVIHKYNSTSFFDVKIALNASCRGGNINVARWLIKNTDTAFFDLNMAILESCNSNKHDVISLIVDSINPFSFDMNIVVEMCQQGRENVVEQLLRIVSVVVLPEIIDFARKALKKRNLEILQWLIENLQTSLFAYSNNCFDLKSALNNACKRKGPIKVVEYLLQNVVHTQLDMRTAIDIAIERNNLDIVKLLLNNDSHRSIDVNRVMIDACRFGRSNLIENVLLANIDQTFFDIETIKKIFHRACRKAELEIVKIFVKYFDNKILDMKTAMTNACFCGNVKEVRSIAGVDLCTVAAFSQQKLKVVKWIVENVANTLFDVRAAIDSAIGEDGEYFNFDIIDFLFKRLVTEDILSNITNLKKLMTVSCFHFNQDIVQLLIDKVDNSLLGIDTVMNRACSNGRIDVVQWLVENVDNTLFDVKTALNYALAEDVEGDDEDECYNFDIIELLLKRCIDEDVLPNITNLEKLIRVSCFNFNTDIMQLLIEKVDNSLLGIDSVMNEACSNGRIFVVQWLVENVDNTLFDVKTALNYALAEDVEGDDEDECYNFDIIELLLKICIDEDVLPNITNFEKLMRVSCFNFHTVIMQLLIEKVDNSLLGIDNVMNRACSIGTTDEVKWLVEHVDNTFLNFNTAMSNVCSRPDGLDLAMWLLANIDDKEIDMNTSFINACSHGNHYLLKWLLETCGRQYFDAKTALNVSCINGHFSTVKYLLENFDIQHFDFATAIIKVCRSQSKDSVEIGKCLLNKFNHNVFDLAKAMNNACRYGNLDVAKWLFEMTNIDVFDMSEALKSACQCDKDVVVKWIISNIPTEKINVQTAIKYACRNHSNNLSIINCFVKSSVKINLDLNILVKEACTYERTDVIERMLENCDKDSFLILDLLTSLVNIDNSLETHVIDKHDKSQRDSKKQNLILKILKNNIYLSVDYNSILGKSCSEGWIDIFKWIITKIDNTELNITDAVNIASQNGRCELINWSLSNLNPDQIDANTILVEASGFGFIEVVQSICSRPDKCKLNFKNAMNDACEYGRGEVVTWLLKNNAKDVFDLSMVMSAACRNGWMDTLNWILENADYMLLNIDYAIIEACAAGNIDIVRELFSTFGKDHFDQHKLSTRICEKVGNEKVVLFLLENLNADGFQMNNLLNKASGFGWLEVVSWIMVNDPEIDTVGAAFENACVNCEIDIVKYLQDKNSRENIQTGLKTACKSGFEEIVEVLLDSLNHEHLDMATLLNEACRCGEQTVVEVLLRKVDNALFDKRAAINEACRSKLPEDLVYFLIKDLQNNNFDNEVVSENARKHSWTKVLMQLKRKS